MSSFPTLHVVGLPHTQTTKRYLHCAYTQKVVKFCKMMKLQGFPVILYSGDENDAECTEHVPLFSEDTRRARFGAWDSNGLFANIDWSSSHPAWAQMNMRAIEEILKRAQSKDFLCLVAGGSQKPLADRFHNILLPVEWAVGYEGISLAFRVFESYAWMHHVYGLRSIKDGAAFDAVIPNFFDPEDFDDTQKPGEHLVFLGRIVLRKGPHVAAEIAKRMGRKLLLAGPGVTHVEPGKIVAPEVTIEGTHVEYVGPVNEEERKKLLSEAACVLMPTQYIEPFGGVGVEAMMSGAPLVASDWGAFTEIITPGVTGERFRTLFDAERAVTRALELDRKEVSRSSRSRYSLAHVGQEFRNHFERLSTLWGEGWYAQEPSFTAPISQPSTSHILGRHDRKAHSGIAGP